VGNGLGFLLFETKRVASSIANKSGSSSTVSMSAVAVICRAKSEWKEGKGSL